MKDTAIVVTREGMGSADQELQMKLLGTWFRLALENDRIPGAILFYTDGVKVAVEGSPVLESLRELERRGARLILCKTCLDHFGLGDRVAVGIVGGMGDILAAQTVAAKVVNL